MERIHYIHFLCVAKRIVHLEKDRKCAVHGQEFVFVLRYDLISEFETDGSSLIFSDKNLIFNLLHLHEEDQISFRKSCWPKKGI